VQGLYSERFLTVDAAGSWVVYTVPAKTRAVIQSVACVVVGGTATQCSLFLGSSYLVNAVVQGNTTLVFTNLRTVAYPGESFGASVTLPGAHMLVSGYLFDDGQSARAPATELWPIAGALPAGGELPAPPG
jgi:hypothetical protein